jgi:hypothetical protein
MTFIGFIIAIYTFINRPIYTGKLRTYYGNTRIVFGNNIFEGTPNILTVNDNPIFTATVKNDKLFISIIIFDREGKLVAWIEENNWEINRNNYFKMEKSPTEIRVINQYGEVALHCIANPDGSVKVTGIFYVDDLQVIATNEGLEINPIK